MPHSEITPAAPPPRPLILQPKTASCASHGNPSHPKASAMLQTWYTEARRENLPISELLHRSTLRAPSEASDSS